MIDGILRKNKYNIWEYDLEKLIEYIERISIKFHNKNELTSFIGVYRDFFDRLEKKHNIKFNYKFIMFKNNSNYKAVYQDYDWCYQKYIGEGLNHNEMAREAGCTVRVIEKWCTEKHKLNQKYRQTHKKINDIQSDLIIGSLLGDGHIDKRDTQPIFIVSHAVNQKDYIYWKYEILKDLCNLEPVYYPEKEKHYQGSKTYISNPFYRLCTRIYDDLIKYRSIPKLELIHKLNEFSFCIWILDDGYRGKSNWQLCIAEMENLYNDIEYILNKKFNIKCKQEKDKRYIRFNAESSRKIDEIILKNIPNELDIVQYKIINNKIAKPANYKFVDYNNEKVGLARFCKTEHINYKEAISAYDSGIIDGNTLISLFKGDGVCG